MSCFSSACRGRERFACWSLTTISAQLSAEGWCFFCRCKWISGAESVLLIGTNEWQVWVAVGVVSSMEHWESWFLKFSVQSNHMEGLGKQSCYFCRFGSGQRACCWQVSRGCWLAGPGTALWEAWSRRGGQSRGGLGTFPECRSQSVEGVSSHPPLWGTGGGQQPWPLPLVTQLKHSGGGLKPRFEWVQVHVHFTSMMMLIVSALQGTWWVEDGHCQGRAFPFGLW